MYIPIFFFFQHSLGHPKWSRRKSPSLSSQTPWSEWPTFLPLVHHCHHSAGSGWLQETRTKLGMGRGCVKGGWWWGAAKWISSWQGVVWHCEYCLSMRSTATQRTWNVLHVCHFRNIECDLNINNGVGIRNTHLLKYYCLCKFLSCCPSIRYSDAPSLCTAVIGRAHRC